MKYINSDCKIYFLSGQQSDNPATNPKDPTENPSQDPVQNPRDPSPEPQKES